MINRLLNWHYINRPYTPESESLNGNFVNISVSDMSQNPITWPTVCNQIQESLITLFENRKDIANGVVSAKSALEDLLSYVKNHQPPAALTGLDAYLDAYLDANAFSRAIANQMAPVVYGGVQSGSTLSDRYIADAQAAAKFLVYYGGEMLTDLLVLALTGKTPDIRVYHPSILSRLSLLPSSKSRLFSSKSGKFNCWLGLKYLRARLFA